MRIAFCTSEVFPFAKTGGLADVSAALSQALADAECQIKVFLPFYRNIRPQKLYDNFGFTKEGKLEFFFVKNNEYFMREGLYGTPKGDYPDNLERFSFFSKQVLEILKKINFSPQIIHSNDWQAALVNVYFKALYQKEAFFNSTKCILTIHNLAYQGLFDKDKFSLLKISQDYFNQNYLEFYGKINILKGGIVFSDLVTTVSPTYAKQIQTSEYGCGLERILKEKSRNLVGILNAIDYAIWNPATDNYIYKKYSPKTLRDKFINKRFLQKELGLKVDRRSFLLGMVSRLAEQKGLDILLESLDAMLEKYQVIILGVGDEGYHKRLAERADRFKGSFSLNLKFDEGLAHKIYAASDVFLMPSRFEPCGLSQMISYKYATVPLVHHTGGLIDTVLDVSQGGGGFVFKNYTESDFLSAVERAYEVFKDEASWQAILKRVVSYDFSWKTAAQHYLDNYKMLIGNS